jgi:hypothetical protein
LEEVHEQQFCSANVKYFHNLGADWSKRKVDYLQTNYVYTYGQFRKRPSCTCESLRTGKHNILITCSLLVSFRAHKVTTGKEAQGT